MSNKRNEQLEDSFQSSNQLPEPKLYITRDSSGNHLILNQKMDLVGKIQINPLIDNSTKEEVKEAIESLFKLIS
jgi:hypothetical protein